MMLVHPDRDHLDTIDLLAVRRARADEVLPDTRFPSPVHAALVAIALAALLPFICAAIPSMTDLPGHIGRYHVMTAVTHSASLAKFYSFEWSLTGNLGVDLLVRAIFPWIDVERAARIISAGIVLLTIGGIVAVSRAVHGRVQPTAVAACCFVLSNPLMFGFVNYCLSFALALLTFALWVSTRAQPAWRQLFLLLLPVSLVWLSHAMGWGVLGILVAGYEGERLWRSRRTTGPKALIDVTIRCLAFVPPLLLTVMWRNGGSGALYAYGSDIVVRKLMNWVVVLRGENQLLDIGTPALLAIVFVALLYVRALRLDWRIATGAILTAFACLLMPTTMFGSWGADERLAPAAVIVLILSLRWTAGLRGAFMLVALAATLFIVRTVSIARDWRNLDAAYASHLLALNQVPVGARIHVIVLQDVCHSAWRSTAYNHLGSLAIARRDALVNTQWYLPGAALLHVVYPVAPSVRNDPSQLIDGFNCAGADLTRVRGRLATLASSQWDYVWILRTRATPNLWPGHSPVFIDSNSALYRMR